MDKQYNCKISIPNTKNYLTDMHKLHSGYGARLLCELSLDEEVLETIVEFLLMVHPAPIGDHVATLWGLNLKGEEKVTFLPMLL